MSARAGEWHLLGRSGDPVPGDPYAVAQAARHYSSVATMIEQQTARLRAMAEDGELVGKYASSLRDKAHGLAGDLEKAHGRYQAVGSALTPYGDDLQRARDESWRALQDAVDADAQQSSAAGMPKPEAQPGTPLTDEQKTALQQRSKALTAAGDAMDHARGRLGRALDDLDDAADRTAKAIRDASHDGLKDSFWDKVKSIAVKVTKIVVEVASWVATIAAVVSLFIPGVNIIAAIALGATLIALAGHTALALTGNGSWFDVALDVFALVTLGGGRLATAGLRTTESTTMNAARAVAGRQQGAYNRALNAIERRVASGSGAARAQALADRAALGARPARASSLPALARSAREAVGVREALRFGGDIDSAAYRASINALRAAYPTSTSVAEAAARAGRYSALGTASWAAGTTADLGDKFMGSSEITGYQGVGAYNEFKDRFTYQVIPW